MSITITIAKDAESKTVTIANDKVSDFETGLSNSAQSGETTVATLTRIIKSNVYAHYASGKEENAQESLDAGVDSDVLSES